MLIAHTLQTGRVHGVKAFGKLLECFAQDIVEAILRDLYLLVRSTFSEV